MKPKYLHLRRFGSVLFASIFGFGLWRNGASIPIAVVGALVMWSIGVGTDIAILFARHNAKAA